MRFEALANVGIFRDLTPEELSSLAERMRDEHAATGTEVIRRGDEGGEFYVLLDGTLEVHIDGRVVNRLGPGDFLGELAILFDLPRTATAVATSPCTLSVLARDDFTALMTRFPRIEDKILAVAAQRMRYR